MKDTWKENSSVIEKRREVFFFFWEENSSVIEKKSEVFFSFK